MILRMVGLLVLAGLVVGCGNTPTPERVVEKKNQEVMKEESDTASATTVAVISPALSSQYHVQFVQGAIEEGKSYGWDILALAGDRETNFAAQVDLVESAVRKGVDAITICAINDKAITGAIEKANEAKIPVFMHNSLTELEGVEIAGYTGFDQRTAGKLCGEYVAQKLSEKNGDATSTVYLITGIPGYHSNERVTGFLEVIGRNPNIHLVGSGPGNWERLGGMNLAQTALKAHSHIDLIYAVSDAMAQGAAQAVQEAGKDTMIVGLDGNPDTLQDIKNGVLTASLAVFPKEMGKIAMRNIKKLLDGGTAEKRNETPLEMIDSSNVDKYLK